MVRVALKKDHPGDRYGRVLLDRDRVRTFLAPGTAAERADQLGVYCIDRGILSVIDELPVFAGAGGVPAGLAEKEQLRAALI